MLMAGCTCIVFAGLRLNLKFMGLNLRRREDMERQELIREDDRERSRMRTRTLVQVGDLHLGCGSLRVSTRLLVFGTVNYDAMSEVFFLSTTGLASLIWQVCIHSVFYLGFGCLHGLCVPPEECALVMSTKVECWKR